MGAIKSMLESHMGEGAYVVSLKIGDSVEEDTKSGFVGNVNDQVRDMDVARSDVFGRGAVSYTHLTLPTICSV